MRYSIAAVLAALALLTAAGCADVDQDGDDGGWTIPEEDSGDPAEPDTGTSPDTTPEPDTDPPPPDVGTPGPCPDEVMERDGVCSEDCADVDPDCADCPDPEDPDVNYVGGSYEDPQKCQLLDFACEEGWEGFGSRLCGCGCRKKEDTGGGGGICGAMDAEGQGNCRAVLGVTFDGESCRTVGGCSCEGADCDRLYGTVGECERATGDCDKKCGDPESAICDSYPAIDPRECPEGTVYTVKECEPMCVDPMTCQPPDSGGESCGGWQGPCSDAQWCDYPENSCGAADQSGTCKQRPRGCPENYAPVCGCDNQTYGNACMAHAAGVDIVSTGECQ